MCFVEDDVAEEVIVDINLVNEGECCYGQGAPLAEVLEVHVDVVDKGG
jgi:hypothetical protein